MNAREWLQRTRRHPSAVLLVVQLIGMLLYPFLDRTLAGRIGFTVITIAVLIVTVGMVRRTPGLTWVSGVIAVPAIALLGISAVVHEPALEVASAALEALFYFYAAASLIAYMTSDWRATADEMYAAGATFTLLAWGFADLFLLVQALEPGAFAAAVAPNSPRNWTELLYLSFALLSSTGIGDVIPITSHARSVAALEMFVGVMYIAGVVSRLIGQTLINHSRE